MYNAAIAVLLTLLVSIPSVQAAPAAWIARSNALAEPVLQDRGKFNPEFASFNGSEEFDTAVIDLRTKPMGWTPPPPNGILVPDWKSHPPVK